MKLLPTEFRKNGFQFRQIQREGSLALFEKSLIDGKYKCWEVVIVQEDQDREIAGVKIDAHERLPGNETWGTLGWTATTKQQAEHKYFDVAMSMLGL